MNDYDRARDGLIPITIDLIKTLRGSRQNAEANELLKAFQDNNQSMWEQERKELNTKENKISRHLKLREGLCAYCGLETPLKGKCTCEKCLAHRRAWDRRKRNGKN